MPRITITISEQTLKQINQTAANMNKPASKFGKWNGSQTIRRVSDQQTGDKR